LDDIWMLYSLDNPTKCIVNVNVLDE